MIRTFCLLAITLLPGVAQAASGDLPNDSSIQNKTRGTLKIGTCDWSLKMPLSRDSFEFAKEHGLQGIQYSFDAQGKGIDLRTKENRDAIREIVKETGVAISSLGIGLLNKIPLASTDEGEQLVVECLEAMAKLKEEATALEDRDLAAKVAPKIVLLAFFNKGDINGKPELIKKVIEKLKRLAPLAEKHGFVLGLETLLNEAGHRHILDSVGSSAVKVYYDTGNAARMGYDIFKEMKSLGSGNICEIHIKENRELLGKGDIDFEKVKATLGEMNYEGWLILEGSVPKGTSRPDATTQNAIFAKELFSQTAPNDSVEHLFVAKQLLRSFENVDLTDEQRVAFDDLSHDLRKQVDVMREEVGITKELIKVRDSVYKQLKKTELEGDALWNSLQEKAKLTASQRDVFRKTPDLFAQFRKDALGLLTEEQRASVRKLKKTKK